jgi:hypothetical protein
MRDGVGRGANEAPNAMRIELPLRDEWHEVPCNA